MSEEGEEGIEVTEMLLQGNGDGEFMEEKLEIVRMPPKWQPVTSQPRGSTQEIRYRGSDIASTVYENTKGEVFPWQYPHGKRRQWSTGLFDCFSDISTCLMGTFVPCHLCFMASDMGESLCAALCVPNAGLVLRALFRGRHNIEGSVMNDCLATVFCHSCAQCQLAREISMIQKGEASP
ncbi:cornifelin homolog B-like [Diadema antillarum]|uniref:cornifelin homolog B-like n=1 Tax=Diadema antillarum TaxID=105358 RepID=UPI003A8471A8